jgi:hypothetical protein
MASELSVIKMPYLSQKYATYSQMKALDATAFSKKEIGISGRVALLRNASQNDWIAIYAPIDCGSCFRGALLLLA